MLFNPSPCGDNSVKSFGYQINLKDKTVSEIKCTYTYDTSRSALETHLMSEMADLQIHSTGGYVTPGRPNHASTTALTFFNSNYQNPVTAAIYPKSSFTVFETGKNIIILDFSSSQLMKFNKKDILNQ